MTTISNAIKEALLDYSHTYDNMTYNVTDGRWTGEVLLQDNCIIIAIYDYEANTECIYNNDVSYWREHCNSDIESLVNSILFYNEIESESYEND